MSEWIGKWAQRQRATDRRPATKAHLVESEKLSADVPRLVMRCGREMPLHTAGGRLEEFVARENESRCETCLR